MATGFLKRLALPVLSLSALIAPVLAQELGEEQAIQLPDLSKALDFLFGFPVGTPIEVLTLKVLFFFALIAIFATLLIKTKIFGDKTAIAAILGLIMALFAVKFTPIDPLLTFASTLGVGLSVLLILGFPLGFLWFVWTVIPQNNTHRWQIMGAATIFAGAALIVGNITSFSIARVFGPSSFFAQIVGVAMVAIGIFMFFRSVNFAGWRAAFVSAEATEKDVSRELEDIREVDKIELKEEAVANTIESELTQLSGQISNKNFAYAMPAVERIEKEVGEEQVLLKQEQSRLKATVAQAKAAIAHASGGTKTTLKTYLQQAEARLEAIERSLGTQNNAMSALLTEEFAGMKEVAILLKENKYVEANVLAQQMKQKVRDIKNRKMLGIEQQRKLQYFVKTLLTMTHRSEIEASQGRVETTILTNKVVPILARIGPEVQGMLATYPHGTPEFTLVSNARALIATSTIAVHNAQINTNVAQREALLNMAVKELVKAKTELLAVSKHAGIGAGHQKLAKKAVTDLNVVIPELEIAIRDDMARIKQLKSK